MRFDEAMARVRELLCGDEAGSDLYKETGEPCFWKDMSLEEISQIESYIRRALVAAGYDEDRAIASSYCPNTYKQDAA